MDKRFPEPGDIVRFSTGNAPDMCVLEIVEHTSGEPYLRCGWFDGEQDYFTAKFPLVCLMIVKFTDCGAVRREETDPSP